MRFRRRHLPVLVLAASLAVPAVAGANDLDNGSFESGLQGWSALNARLAVKNGGPSGGTFARASRRTAGEFGLVTRPGDDLQAGRSLSVRASLRSPRALQVCVRVRERRASGALVATSTRCVRATGGWQRSPALRYVTRRGDTQLVLSFLARGRGTGRVDVDNVVLNFAPLTTPPTAPANTSAPDVSGTAEQGQTLNASAGSWSGSTPMAYGYQWRRCDASGGACTNVSGATGTSFTLAVDDVGATLRVRVTATNSVASAGVDSAQTAVVTTTTPDPDPEPDPDPGTVITTNRPWSCTGSLASFGPLPVKVVSTIANAGANDNDNAINLRGCYGDGNPATVDLIIDVRGNGADVGTSYDVVRIGQNARDLVVTGNAECGARNSDPSIHQDIVQALSGSRITFVDFTSGDPFTGRWTCWGAGGGWYITWANAGIPTDLICLRCILATYNQNLRIGESIRSGARDSVFGYSRSYGIFVESVAQSPVNENNRVIRY